MKLCDLCGNVYAACVKIKSQVKFIDRLFAACGAKPYISDSYKKQLFNGEKPFTNSIKDSFRGIDNQQALEKFFCDEIADNKLPDVIANFGIPEKDEPNKKALAAALVLQTKALIDSEEEESEDIIASAYQMAKETSVEESNIQDVPAPKYIGDGVYIQSNDSHKVGCYETVTHTWSIVNTGKITWVDRKLVYKRGPKDRPEANPSEIPIPDVPPGESTKLITSFDPRGFDGRFRCIWEMQDSNGDNCFPGRELSFGVMIDAKFRRN